MQGIIAHCDSRFVQTDEIYRVPKAPGSETYSPVAHGVVRDELLERVRQVGLRVTKERWALSSPQQRSPGRSAPKDDPSTYNGPGARAFGLLQLASDQEDWATSIAVRNSQDKTLALGIATGGTVFICDNLVLSGDHVMYRRHTSRFNIRVATIEALSKALTGTSRFQRFFESLKGAPVNDEQFDGIVCDGIRQGILTGTGPADLLNAWHDKQAPREDRFGFAERLAQGVYEDRNAWSAHNLWTDLVAKRQTLTTANNRPIETHATMNTIFRTRVPQLSIIDG